MIYLRNLAKCLLELSDSNFQRLAFLASSGPVVSSFSELVAQTFDDTGLADALDKDRCPPELDALKFSALKNLDQAVARVDQNAPPEELLTDPRVKTVREIAAHALKLIVSKDLRLSVEVAVLEIYPEDGLTLYLKDFVVAGHREEVVDALLDAMEAGDSDIRYNVLTLIYLLHATHGKVITPGMADPRPENAQRDEPLAYRQLDRLVDSALADEDRSLWDSYCSLFDNLSCALEFPDPIVRKLKIFADRCLAEGSDNARTRCGRLARNMD